MIYRRRRSVIDFECNDPTVRSMARTPHVRSDKDKVSVWLPIRSKWWRWRRSRLQDR